MGLFDLFKKKPAASAEINRSEKKIEFVLRKATEEPAYRPELYKLLMSEPLVIMTGPHDDRGENVLEKGSEVSIVTLKSGEIPVFTSEERILDNGIVKEEFPIMTLRGEDLFRMTTGATFKLNPFSNYRKDLLPQEVESMLDGTILESGRKRLVADGDTPVQIGQPVEYPAEIVASLQTLFSGMRNVNKAYLGWIHNPSDGYDPHLIFALDLDGEEQETFDAAGFTIREHLPQGEVVDFMPIGEHSLSDYFTQETQPFYTRN